MDWSGYGKNKSSGTSTLLGSQEPIWVVDGIIQEDPLPFDAQTFNSVGEINSDNFDYIRNFVGSSISWLNPSDIESITVLKRCFFYCNLWGPCSQWSYCY